MDLDYDLSRRHVHLHREQPPRDPAAAAGPHGDHPAPRLHRAGEAADREGAPRSRRCSRTTVWTKTSLIEFSDSAISTVIRHYTKESGVRNLERELASVCAKGRAQGRDRRRRREEDARHAEAGEEVPGRRALPLRRDREEDKVGVATGPRLHRGGRRAAADRGRGDARPRQAAADGSSRRGDAGVRRRGDVLHPIAREAARPVARLLLEGRHPHPRAGRRHAEGRTLGRHHARDDDRLGADARGRSGRTLSA